MTELTISAKCINVLQIVKCKFFGPLSNSNDLQTTYSGVLPVAIGIPVLELEQVTGTMVSYPERALQLSHSHCCKLSLLHKNDSSRVIIACRLLPVIQS